MASLLFDVSITNLSRSWEIGPVRFSKRLNRTRRAIRLREVMATSALAMTASSLSCPIRFFFRPIARDCDLSLKDWEKLSKWL